MRLISSILFRVAVLTSAFLLVTTTATLYDWNPQPQEGGAAATEQNDRDDVIAQVVVVETEMKGIKEILKEIKASIQEGNEAIKKQIKADMNEFKTELKADMNEVKTELKADINEVKTELKADMNEVKKELSEVKKELSNEIKRVDEKLSTVNDMLSKEIQAVKDKFWPVYLLICVTGLANFKDVMDWFFFSNRWGFYRTTIATK
jgi:DNA anti-recombination protein RmuC